MRKFRVSGLALVVRAAQHNELHAAPGGGLGLFGKAARRAAVLRDHIVDMELVQQRRI